MPVRDRRSTRLVVLCQRHPWTTSLVVAFAVAGAAGPWMLRLLRRDSPDTWATLLMLVPVGFAFLGHVGRGGRTSSDVLAPWLAANVAVVAASLAYTELTPWGIPWWEALMVTAPFAFWPLVAAALLPGAPPGDETPAALVGYPATLLLLPPIVAAVFDSADLWFGGTALCLAVVPLAFHAVVRSRWPTGRILFVAALLGAASFVLRPAQLDRYVPEPGGFLSVRREMALLVPVGVWFAGALLAVAARRCRSMTAVPADHPLVVDLGAVSVSARGPSRRP